MANFLNIYNLQLDVLKDINGNGVFATATGQLKFLQPTSKIISNTTDGNDNQILGLGGGGDISATRGAYINLAGNESANVGNIIISSGSIAGAGTYIDAPASNGNIFFRVNGTTLRWSINNSGDLVGDGTGGGNIIFNKSVGRILQTTNLQELQVGDTSLGAYLSLSPNGTAPTALLASGTSSGGSVIIRGSHSAAGINFQTGGTTNRWQIPSTGHFLPAADAIYDIGSVSSRIQNLYSGGTVGMDVLGSANGTGILATTSSGTTRALRFFGTTNIIQTNTSDGSDTAEVHISGGGATGFAVPIATRGAYISLFGNQGAGSGRIDLVAGNIVGGGVINIITGGVQRWQYARNGNIIFSNATATIVADTSDGSDTKSIEISGGGAASDGRGGTIALYGEQHGSQPGEVRITSVGSGGIFFRTNTSVRWKIDSTGKLLPELTDTYDLGAASNRIKDLYVSGTLYLNGTPITGGGSGSLSPTEIVYTGISNVFNVRADTTDGSDNKGIVLGGGGTNIDDSRGARCALYGNESAGVGGNAYLITGNVTGATLFLSNRSSNGSITFQTAGANNRWFINNVGHFIPNNDIGYDIGTPALRVRSIYANAIDYAYKPNFYYTDSQAIPNADAVANIKAKYAITAGRFSGKVIVAVARSSNDSPTTHYAEYDVSLTQAGGFTIHREVKHVTTGDAPLSATKWYYDSTSKVATLEFAQNGNTYTWSVTFIGDFPFGGLPYTKTYNNTPPVGTEVTTATVKIHNGAISPIITSGLAANRAAIINGSAQLDVSSVTSTELGYLSGATSSIQTQLNSKVNNVLTTTGDIIYSSSGSTPARLGIGSTGQVLTVVGGVPTWSAGPGGSGGIGTLNTLTANTQTFATGTSGTDFNISSVSSTHTFNIPDASASARGLITTGAQTIAGNKTFSGQIILSASVASIASDTSDGSDNKTITISGGGAFDIAGSRGGGIELQGNEAGGGTYGTVRIASGTTSNSAIELRANNTSGTGGIRFLGTTGQTLWTVNAGGGGNLVQDSTNGGFLDFTRNNVGIRGPAAATLSLNIGAAGSFAIKNSGGTDLWSFSEGGSLIQSSSAGNIIFNSSTNAQIRGGWDGATTSRRIQLWAGQSGSVLQGAIIDMFSTAAGGHLDFYAGTSGNFRFYRPGSGSVAWSISSLGDSVGEQSTNTIRTNTADATDNSNLVLTGGGAFTSSGTRGGGIALRGNEVASVGGSVELSTGNSSTANLDLRLNNGSGQIRIRNSSDVSLWAFLHNGRLEQDATNGGPLVLSRGSSAGLIVGTSTVHADITTAFGTTPPIVVQQNNNTADSILSVATSANAVGAHFYGAKTRSSAGDADTIVQDGDELVSLGGWGADGGTFRPAGAVRITVDGTPASNVMPGRIDFFTTTAAGMARRWWIDSAGHLNQDGTNGGNIRFNSTIGLIHQNTADGADTKSVQIAGGGTASSTRGGTIQVYGNENGSFGGLAWLSAGNSGSRPHVELVASASSGQVKIKTQDTERWNVLETGHLEPAANVTYDVGSSSLRVKKLWVQDIDLNGTLIGSSGGGITWNNVTGTSQAMSVQNGYIANNAALVTLTLPSTCAVGETIRVAGAGAGGWRIAQNSGQTIYLGDTATTTGASGQVNSTHRRDSVELLCITANTEFTIISSSGTLDLV